MAVIARDAEIHDVVDRLRRHRLVTIVGPGGVGKTALARVAADIAGADFAMGALAVDLTRVDGPDAVAELIAGQLGVADFHSLINSPSDQPALLVIDNCEHVLDAAADAIDTILASCRMPTVLATSRSPLDVAEEVIVPLAPLPVPPPDLDDLDVGAARMFVERVVDFGGSVHPDDRHVVAEICRRLDGVPLALEIAAARSRTATLAQILDEIAARPSRLSRPRFRGHAAHRSVSDMVGWSLQLLDDDARRAFDELGVISGPFDLPMAAAVISVTDDRSAADVLDELVAASLVVPDTSGPEVRYRLLHPVRAVAAERLRQAAAETAAIDRAVGHVVDVAIGVVLDASAGWGDQLRLLLANYDNIIASLRWANEHDETSDRPLTLLAVLWGVVHQAHTAEVAAVGESVIARWDDPSAPFWADAAATVATCRNLLGRSDDAIELASTALAHADSSSFAPASLRRVIAQATRASGRVVEARDWFAAAADAAADASVHGLAMELRVDEAVLESDLGDLDGALTKLDDVLAEATRRDAPINRAWAMCGRGAVLQRWERPESLDALETAVAYSRSIAYPAGTSFGLRLIAAEHLRRDDRIAAGRALLELLFSLLERGGLNELRMLLDHAARLFELEGDERWVDVAVTAQALPVTTVAAAVTSDVFDRAAGRGTVLPTRDVYELCRDRLAEIASRGDDAADTGDDDGETSDDRRDRDLDVGPAIRREGDVWRWTYAGDSVVVKASKGMNDLARLLSAPHREISAMDLMGSTKVGNAAADSLDVRARREVEERIRDLQSEVEEAEANHDLARAERSAVELDRLVEELASSVGLGGRPRASGTDPERARSAVTQRIRSTITRIDAMHPKLGGHLSTAVGTGTFCAYHPTDDVTWTITS